MRSIFSLVLVVVSMVGLSSCTESTVSDNMKGAISSKILVGKGYQLPREATPTLGEHYRASASVFELKIDEVNMDRQTGETSVSGTFYAEDKTMLQGYLMALSFNSGAQRDIDRVIASVEEKVSKLANRKIEPVEKGFSARYKKVDGVETLISVHSVEKK